MNILVTGGAGYVGSIVAEVLLREHHSIVVLDNLQQGHRDAISRGAQFAVANICDETALEGVFSRFRFDAVMHLAAETVVEFSMTDPRKYMLNNVVGGINLLEAMLRHGVAKLIFSSSAAVYGQPESNCIREEATKIPVNAYGESKLMFERILDWYGRAYGLKHISLRYFNAAGASHNLGEDHNPETHIIPNVLRAALDGNRPVSIFGTDYPTRDGSCIRDYVHVVDIAQGHILALKNLDVLRGRAYNLGNGAGYSVMEVVGVAQRVTGIDIPVNICARRPGDPAVLVASSEKARSELGWNPRFPDLESIVASAWRWLKEHPRGYEG